MKRSVTLAFAAALLIGGHSAARDGKPPAAAKHLQFDLRVFEGDPLGSREARTLKVLADPRLITAEGRPFRFFIGGEVAVPNGPGAVEFVEVGRAIAGKASSIKDGKVRLDVTLSNTTVGEGTEGWSQFHTDSTRTITTLKLGSTVKLRWGKGSAERQAWVELSVQEVKP